MMLAASGVVEAVELLERPLPVTADLLILGVGSPGACPETLHVLPAQSSVRRTALLLHHDDAALLDGAARVAFDGYLMAGDVTPEFLSFARGRPGAWCK